MHLALVHWPCLDKNGQEITTAITNLDLHDLARVGLTYGIDTLYIVHPYQSQLDFAKKIVDHWLKGFGGVYNPVRKRAFELIRLVRDLDEVRENTGAFMIGTTAREYENAISFNEVKNIAHKQDVCLLFGTGWGLAPRIFAQFDAVTEPITGVAEYNHISVRSAVAIIIDRLIGR
ncbi:MAG: RNA methyltransferase [Deltaproteobacteria bacterium]|nr:RNA methyltransferase [Deltaproteobacteria bacterium]